MYSKRWKMRFCNFAYGHLLKDLLYLSSTFWRRDLIFLSFSECLLTILVALWFLIDDHAIFNEQSVFER